MDTTIFILGSSLADPTYRYASFVYVCLQGSSEDLRLNIAVTVFSRVRQEQSTSGRKKFSKIHCSRLVLPGTRASSLAIDINVVYLLCSQFLLEKQMVTKCSLDMKVVMQSPGLQLQKAPTQKKKAAMTEKKEKKRHYCQCQLSYEFAMCSSVLPPTLCCWPRDWNWFARCCCTVGVCADMLYCCCHCCSAEVSR
jgi:hypothetical protein